MLPATPQILLATVDPGGFGATDGVLEITFDRPVVLADASELEATLDNVGTFSFDNGPDGVSPDFRKLTWLSTAWAAGDPGTTVVTWAGSDGPIVFEGGGTLSDFVHPATWL